MRRRPAYALLAAWVVACAGVVPSAATARGVSGVTASASGSQVKVSGWVTFNGEAMGAATDSDTDAATPGGAPTQPAAAATGAEIIGGDLTYRPELGDLFVRIRVTSIPVTGPLVGDPGVLYAMRTVVGGVPVEVRAQSIGIGALFGLFECRSENGCTLVDTPIAGGYGTTGAEIVAAVPLTAFTAATGKALREGDQIGTPIAFTARAPFTAGAVNPALYTDQLVLRKAAKVTVPAKSVTVTVGTTARKATLSNGRFTVSFPASAWGGRSTATATARTCLGSSCVVQKFSLAR